MRFALFFLLGTCALVHAAQDENEPGPESQREALTRMAEIASSFKVASANRSLTTGNSNTIIEKVVLDVYTPLAEERPSSFYYGIPYLQVPSLGFYEAYGASLAEPYACHVESLGDYTFVRVDLPSTFDLVDSVGYIAGKRSTPLTIELHFNGYAQYKNKFSEIFSTGSSWSYGHQPNLDRLLAARLCAEALLPYQCGKQTTTILFERGMYKFHDNDPAVEVGPYDVATASITAGPYYDNEPGFCTRVDIEYYSNLPSLQIEAERNVYVKGVQLYSQTEHPKYGPVRIVDSFKVINTDPKPGSGRYSRATAGKLAANKRTVPLPSSLTVSLPPGAKNIKVFDRVGQIQSWDSTDAAGETLLKVHPRHDLAGQDKSLFSVSYDVDLVRAAAEDQDEGTAQGRILQVSLAAPVGDSFYKSTSLCVYLPETASDVELYTPIPDLRSSEIQQDGAILSMTPRKGVCIERGVSSRALVKKEVLVSWRADDLTLATQKLCYLAMLISTTLGIITLGRVCL